MSGARAVARGPTLQSALDQLLAERWAPSAWQRIDRADELPHRFGRLVDALPEGAWRAYSDGARLRFAVGAFTAAPGSRRNRTEIKVHFYDTDARACGAGIWTQLTPGRWSLRESID